MPDVRTFDELRRYVRFTEDSGTLLRAFLPEASPHFERLAAEFYERIREHEDAHALLADEAQIQRLHGTMVTWMRRILSGPWDRAYIAQSAAIGQVHIRVGVPPRFVCTAMNLLRIGLTRIAHDSRIEPRDRLLAAIHQVLDLELATMIESYCVSYTTRVRHQASLERDALARNLASTERHYEQAVELSGMIVVGIDAAGAIRLFNPEAERTTGFLRDEVDGQDFLDTLVSDADRGKLAPLLNASTAGRVERVNFALRVRSKRLRWLAASISTGLGGDLGTIIMAQDVTESRQLAEKSSRAERLAAVGTLAAGLAHEIRNPLNGAHLHLAFLRRELVKNGADPDVLGAVGVVGDEIQRLSKLVTDFLQFARPRPLDRQSVSLSEVVLRVVRLVTSPNGVPAVFSDLPLTDVTVEEDRDQLEQLLLNLARNSIEALQDRTDGVVILRLRRAPHTAMLEVEDNGPGLPTADVPVFDAFFTTKAGGTGLGLSIVHRIAQDHGGTIEVRSAAGCTVFTAHLPVAQPET